MLCSALSNLLVYPLPQVSLFDITCRIFVLWIVAGFSPTFTRVIPVSLLICVISEATVCDLGVDVDYDCHINRIVLLWFSSNRNIPTKYMAYKIYGQLCCFFLNTV